MFLDFWNSKEKKIKKFFNKNLSMLKSFPNFAGSNKIFL
jgi:hypothetical protein